MKRLHVFLILSLAVFSVYFRSLDYYFISHDEFYIFDFIRGFGGNLLSFLSPLNYSDPVMLSRYIPAYMYFWFFVYGAFGLNPLPYHLLGIVFHSLNAFLVYLLAKEFSLREDASVAAALFFAAYRLNSQVLLWVMQDTRLLSILLVLCSFYFFVRGRGFTLTAVLIYLIAQFMNPELIVFPAFALSYAIIFRGESKGFFGGRAALFAGYLLVAGVFIVTNIVNNYFNVDGGVWAGFVDPTRFLVFMLDLCLPYALPFALKAVLLAILAYAVWVMRGRLACFLVSCILVGAIFWSFMGGYSLQLRYFYLYSVFFSLLIGHGLSVALGAASDRAAVKHGIRVLAALFILFNAFLVVTQDMVWMGYLSGIGHAVGEIAKSSPGLKKVHIFPLTSFGDVNRKLVSDNIVFVGADGVDGDTILLDTGVERYEEYFGEKIGDTYWYNPWFYETLPKGVI
jgi:hypothetical protein